MIPNNPRDLIKRPITYSDPFNTLLSARFPSNTHEANHGPGVPMRNSILREGKAHLFA